MTPSPRPPPSTDHDERIQNKEEILAAIERLSESGIKISVEQIHGRDDLIAELVELTTEFRATTDHLRRLNGSISRHETDLETLKLRAAARDAMCPLVEVLRAEVRGIQTAILKDLRAARDLAVQHKAELEAEDRWEKRLMPFIRPAVIALISAIFTLLVVNGQALFKAVVLKVP
jgi:hypothetical protein